MGASLTEEALSKILGCKMSRAAFLALEAMFAHSSLSRANQLCVKLLALHRDSLSVDEFARKFKLICNQLAVIGRPVDNSDKTHWFLCGWAHNSFTSLTLIWLCRMCLCLVIC